MIMLIRNTIRIERSIDNFKLEKSQVLKVSTVLIEYNGFVSPKENNKK